MRVIRLFAAGALASVIAFAQSAPTEGLESQWTVRKLLDALAAGAARLKPLVDQADPAKWSNPEGASTYTPQWQTAVKQIDYFIGATEKFARSPEKLPPALETYFRMQAMNSTILSFAEGVRKYYNPTAGDLLAATVGENAAAREHLRQYLVELAEQKEQEYQIMDKEAQRCRAMITRQPQPASRDRSNTRSRD
jgi:hypothetical protein